jgi:hypothetical protein
MFGNHRAHYVGDISMSTTEQIVRLLSIPVAISVFLLAAQVSGGFIARDKSAIYVAMR